MPSFNARLAPIPTLRFSGTYLGIQRRSCWHSLLQDDQGTLRYAHHVVIDELQNDLAMDKRNPASRFLAGQVVDTGHRGALTSWWIALESPLIDGSLTTCFKTIMPGPLATQLGIATSMCPALSVAVVTLNLALTLRSILLGFVRLAISLLAINGTSVRTVEDVTDCFHFISSTLKALTFSRSPSL
jgi:hypothetical protein